MSSFKALLAGAALGVFSLASAQAGEFVEWQDDGTVLLKLGKDYDDAVITANKADLGALFGPDEKPFEGEEITVLTLDSGPKGGISGPIYAFRPIFEELTGAKLNIALVPISELYTKLFLDLRNGTGEYDGSIVGAFMYGDLIDGKYILPLDEWRQSGDYPQWSYDVMPPALKNIYTWGDVGYGVLGDADGQILYYRRDMLTNPEHMAAFKAQYGYDLPAPPATLQQLKDIAAYFHGKNFDTVDDEPDSGAVLHLKVREQGLYHFMTLATSFAMTPGDLTRTTGVYWFDPVDMKPLINSPGHVKALEYLQGPGAVRAGGAGQLEPGRGLGLLPARQGDLQLLLRRRGAAGAGRGALEDPRQDRLGHPARVRHLLGHEQEGVRDQRRAALRSATSPAAPGTAWSPACPTIPRRPTPSGR